MVVNHLKVNVEFNSILPDSLQEVLENLLLATSGDRPVVSQETAVGLNPLVHSPSEEFDRIKKEQTQVQNLGESFDV